jgi:putative ABC transport system permease protein
MAPIAIKNMRAEKGRFAFSVLGVAVSSLLLAFVLALYSGWTSNIASYVSDVPADVWVVQEGNESFFSASFVPNGKLDEIRQLDGVERVDSLLGRTLKISKKAGGERWDSYVVGFDAGGAGGPEHIKSGRGDPADGEIVIDDVLARTAGIHVGDTVLVGDVPLKVTGISTGGNIVISQLSFVSMAQAEKVVGLPGIRNFVLVTAEEGQAPQVKQRINSGAVEGVHAYESKEFSKLSRKVLERSMLPILTVVLVLVFAVGAVIVGLTIYTATVEKEREFGVMKALGAENRRIASIVVQQSLACGAFGFTIGYAAVLLASSFAQRLVPQFVTAIRWQDALIVFVGVAVMCIIASYLPLQRVMRVDPLRVFKA